MMTRVSVLLRTNIALALLCLISIGVWYTAIHRRGEEIAPAAAPHMTENVLGAQSLHVPIVPDTATFIRFVYTGDESLGVPIRCNDEYAVVMIFPVDVDWQGQPRAAAYNAAAPCAMGTESTTTIDIASVHLVQGTEYRIVRASQGKTGSWHDPY